MNSKKMYITIIYLLLLVTVVHAADEILIHEWERGGYPHFTVETRASVNTNPITGSGIETIPVSDFLLTFMYDGAPCRWFGDPWNRTWQEADQDKVAPESRIIAVYQDGVFRNFISGGIPLVPPAVWNGEWVVLQMPGPSPMLIDYLGGQSQAYGLIKEPDPPENQPPVADASNTDTEVISTNGTNADVLLDGSLSYDPDEDPLTYSWSEGGIEIATGQTPTIPLSVGEHTIGLSVDDGNGGTDYDEVTITVIADRDGDGVPDDEDLNDNSDLRETVVVGGSETGVPNQVDVWGMSIQDYINEIESEEYPNHGQYISTVAHLAEYLLEAGLITEDDADVMMSCAAHSKIGKKDKGGKK